MDLASKKFTVCFAIPSLQAGGMERVMSELAAYSSNRSNVDLHILLYGIKRDIFYQLPKEVTVHIPEFTFNNTFRFVSTVRTLFFLRKVTKRIKPDSILSFGEYWNSFVLLALYGLKFPIFVSDRSQPDKSLGKVQDWLRKRLYPKASGVIAQTKVAKLIYQGLYGHKNIQVIGNPIRSIPNKKLKRDNSILMVGRLIRSKNQDRLIEMFARINKLDWKLVIVGYDHLKQKNMERLQNLIEELKLNDRVILTGKQENVEEYYLTSKIFAFTSTSEGFPNVIGEAMSAGLPVVSFDCIAGPSEMIEDGKNGFLIPVNDYQLFQEKLELLMQDDVLRSKFGEYGKISIQKFSINEIGEQYLKFISNR